MKNGIDTFSVTCKTEKMIDFFSCPPSLRIIHNNIRNNSLRFLNLVGFKIKLYYKIF